MRKMFSLCVFTPCNSDFVCHNHECTHSSVCRRWRCTIDKVYVRTSSNLLPLQSRHVRVAQASYPIADVLLVLSTPANSSFLSLMALQLLLVNISPYISCRDRSNLSVPPASAFCLPRAIPLTCPVSNNNINQVCLPLSIVCELT